MSDLETKIKEALEFLKGQIAAIRGSRPSPKLVEDILVDCYEQKMPIKQIASVSVVLPREIQISCWDKEIVAASAKAIEAALKLNVNIDGGLIRLNLPPLSEERREELIKIVKKEVETSRIKLRHLRDETNKKISEQEVKKEISEDEKFKLKEKIQKAIDAANGEIEKILEKKIKEINE